MLVEDRGIIIDLKVIAFVATYGPVIVNCVNRNTAPIVL